MRKLLITIPLIFLAMAASASASRPFSPQLQVSATNSDAGAHPRLSIGVSKEKDGVYPGPSFYDEQDLQHTTITLPTGLNLNPAKVPYCGLVESEDGDYCSNEDSKIGTATVTAQIWVSFFGYSVPVDLPEIEGTVYNESPASGELAHTVVIFESTTYAGETVPGFTISNGATVAEDSLAPSIDIESLPNTAEVDGSTLPLSISGLTLELDGEKGSDAGQPLITNPTSCDSHSFQARFTSYGDDDVSSSDDQTVSDESDYSVTNCEGLSFNPHVTVSVDPLTAGSVPTVKQTVTQTAGEAAIGSTTFSMPAGFKFNRDRVVETCSDSQIESESCPAGSKLGDVTVETPLLAQPLSGASYIGPGEGSSLRTVTFLKNDLVSTQFEGKLTQRSDLGTDTITEDMADMPISKMEYVSPGGSQGLFANPSTCGSLSATGSLTSLSGKSVSFAQSIDITGCVAASSSKSRTFEVKVSPNFPKRRALLKIRLNQSPAATTRSLKMQFAKGLSWRLAHQPRSLAAGFITVTGDDDISHTYAVYPKKSKSRLLSLATKKDSGANLKVKISKSKRGKVTVTVDGFSTAAIKSLAIDLTGRRRLLLRTPKRCSRSTVSAALTDGDGAKHSLTSAISPGCSKVKKKK